MLGSMAGPGGHRVTLARALADGLVQALAAGDVRAARVALDALGGLVDASAAQGEGAAVVDLATARRKRVEA